MSLDLPLVVAACGIGIVVGLTGVGGGALMTPVLVLFFDVLPLTAVSSDLVASAVMKPVGSLVHLRRGTVHLELVKWLCVGSVPAAFAGVLVVSTLHTGLILMAPLIAAPLLWMVVPRRHGFPRWRCVAGPTSDGVGGLRTVRQERPSSAWPCWAKAKRVTMKRSLSGVYR